MKYAVYAFYDEGELIGWYRIPMSGGRFLERRADWYSLHDKRWVPSGHTNVRDLIDGVNNYSDGEMWLSVVNVEFKK